MAADSNSLTSYYKSSQPISWLVQNIIQASQPITWLILTKLNVIMSKTIQNPIQLRKETTDKCTSYRNWYMARKWIMSALQLPEPAQSLEFNQPSTFLIHCLDHQWKLSPRPCLMRLWDSKNRLAAKWRNNWLHSYNSDFKQSHW